MIELLFASLMAFLLMLLVRIRFRINAIAVFSRSVVFFSCNVLFFRVFGMVFLKEKTVFFQIGKLHYIKEIKEHKKGGKRAISFFLRRFKANSLSSRLVMGAENIKEGMILCGFYEALNSALFPILMGKQDKFHFSSSHSISFQREEARLMFECIFSLRVAEIILISILKHFKK